jgi:acyl-CoA thioesterase FadM
MLWLDAWADAARVEELRATLARYARGWRAALADVLSDGARHGSWECPDPAETASRIVAVIDGIGLQAMLHPGEVTPERAAGWARRIVELELGIALPEPVAAPPADPPTAFSVRIGVRGRDLDADGAVHPAAMLAYLEEARDGWLAERLGPAGADTLLARVAVDFRAPLRGQGREVIVRCALRRPGRSSVVTDETISTAAGEVVARADTTLVAVDAGTRRPRALAPAEREALAR